MALKYTIDALVEVPGPLRDEYVKGDDGKFHLQVDGHPDTAKVKQFRDTNTGLLKEKTELTTKLALFDGIDPAAAKAALAKTGDGDEVAALKEKLADAENTATAATQKHDALVFRSLVSSAFLAAGGRPEAVDYIVCKVPFKLVDGELQPNDAATPTLEDYLRDAAVAPATSFAWLPNKGGGSRGDRGKPTLNLGGSAQVRELVNPTAQELGAAAKDIAAGRAKVVITT